MKWAAFSTLFLLLLFLRRNADDDDDDDDVDDVDDDDDDDDDDDEKDSISMPSKNNWSIIMLYFLGKGYTRIASPSFWLSLFLCHVHTGRTPTLSYPGSCKCVCVGVCVCVCVCVCACVFTREGEINAGTLIWGQGEKTAGGNLSVSTSPFNFPMCCLSATQSKTTQRPKLFP